MQKAMNDQCIPPGEGVLHHAEGVDLIPANIELAGMEIALVNAMSREKMLKQVLESAKRDYDYTGIEPVTSCMPCKRSPERYRNTPPTRKCGDRLNIALIRSIHQKGSQLHPASRNHAPPTRQFYHPIFKCVNGFCSERRSFTRKVFSDSLLSAILILHIKVALFIFPKSIDKEVFSTMPIYYRCFLSVNQPHDP